MREFYRHRETQLSLLPVKLNDLVQQVIDLTRARWSDIPMQRGIVIQMHSELASDLPEIMGVESEIREALTNLILNGVDAVPNGGALTVRTKAITDVNFAGYGSVQIEIEDTGVGMDEETCRRCLEPFFTTKGERGTGLGLAMVYGVLQRHGAEINIKTALGAGSTIYLNFPAPRPVATASTEELESMPLPRLRLLLVDDDPVLLKALCDALEADGHIIVTANDGKAGIEVFNSAQARGEIFAAVITDLGMPYVDGRKVAAAIKSVSPTTPIILLTGWGQGLINADDTPPHVDQVLSKPPKLREIREVLGRYCRPL
jgi:CheY-like chemotaxis protein/anti-sigma regulatory factor (Ser/Thr protein kinase)